MIKFEVCKGFEDQNINLPKASTAGSAGYDFEAASDIVIPSIINTLKNMGLGALKANWKELGLKPTLVPTGIKAFYPNNVVLLMFNRSSNPIKAGLHLTNGTGVIDADYYENPDNDGHIQFQFINWSSEDIKIKKGTKIGQGIFMPFLKADNVENSTENRIGGHGSTGV